MVAKGFAIRIPRLLNVITFILLVHQVTKSRQFEIVTFLLHQNCHLFGRSPVNVTEEPIAFIHNNCNRFFVMNLFFFLVFLGLLVETREEVLFLFLRLFIYFLSFFYSLICYLYFTFFIGKIQRKVGVIFLKNYIGTILKIFLKFHFDAFWEIFCSNSSRLNSDRCPSYANYKILSGHVVVHSSSSSCLQQFFYVVVHSCLAFRHWCGLQSYY